MSSLPRWNDDSSSYRSQPLIFRRRLEQYGISHRLPTRQRMLTPRQQIRRKRNEDMRALRAQGWYLKEIARRYRLHITVVSKVCRGVKPIL